MNARQWWLKKAVACTALMLIAVAALGWVVMALWNWLVPPLFGLMAITFWQALGLFLLGRLLFGGFRFFGHRAHRHHMHERWQHMTAEERETFSRGLKRGCRWHRHEESTSASPQS